MNTTSEHKHEAETKPNSLSPASLSAPFLSAADRVSIHARQAGRLALTVLDGTISIEGGSGYRVSKGQVTLPGRNQLYFEVREGVAAKPVESRHHFIFIGRRRVSTAFLRPHIYHFNNPQRMPERESVRHNKVGYMGPFENTQRAKADIRWTNNGKDGLD